MSERLVHFSAEPLAALRKDWGYSPQRPAYYDKPGGFWVSVEGDGDGWSDWCRSEEYATERLTYPHEVTLTADARILRLTTPDEIDAFTKAYPVPGDTINMRIDWPKVAEQYQGIIITPYQWSRRLYDKTRWYYTWDCASGCVWDLDAIESIRLLTPATEDVP